MENNVARRKVRCATLLVSVWPQWADVETGLTKTKEGGLDKERKERQEERGQRDLPPGAQHFR